MVLLYPALVRKILYDVSLLFLIGFFCLSRADAQVSRFDSLQSALEKEESVTKQVMLLNELSHESRKNDFEKSIAFAESARRLAMQHNFNQGVAKSYINTGNAYYFQGRHEQALADYVKAMQVYEQTADSAGVVDVLNEMGTLEKKNGQMESSERHLKRALRISKNLADNGRVANSLNNLGHYYEMKGDLDLAMKLYRESTRIKEKQKEWFAASFNYDNMANVLSRQGRYAEARRYYEREMHIYDSLGDRMNYAIAVNNLGEMYKMKGDPTLARHYFNQGLVISRGIGFKDLTHHIYAMLSETYKDERDYKNAFEYHVRATSLKDSIFNEQKNKQIVDIQARYETEKKENEIRFLKQENELKDLGLRQNNLFILGLILALLAMAIVGFLLFNRIKLKQSVELEATRAALRESQLQAVIKSQEEERRRFAADLHDGLGQIISALRLNLSKDVVEPGTIDQALGLLNEMNGEIRNIAFNLMPHALMKEGLDAALQQFAARINRTDRLHVSVSTFNLSSEISSDQKIALYRICQEWVNNVMKYAGADRISLQLVQHPDELVITIEDNGNGFDPASLSQGQGNGWKNINSRAAMVRGSIEIDSVPGRRGTTLVLAVPVFSLAV